MDIRTKLALTMISVALAAMFGLSLLTVRAAESQFRERTEAQLDGLADFKEDAVEQVLRGWHDRVALVASRTQLRISLREYNRTGSDDAAARMDRILDDAASASPLFMALWVHDRQGATVATAGHADVLAELQDWGEVPDSGSTDIRYQGVVFLSDRTSAVTYSAPLDLDGVVQGVLHVVLSTEEIHEFSANYEGLGETGETVVVAHDSSGAVRALHPLRYPSPGLDGGLPTLRRDGAIARSLGPREVDLEGDLTDYRGEKVFVSTRFVPETGWGVVVKIDETEEEAPLAAFRRDLIYRAVVLAAFPILLGTLIGIRVAEPIHELAETAARIAEGDLKARSGIEREDEVGFLARTFDEMAESLEQQVVLLSEFRKFFDVSIDMMCIASTDGYFKKVNHAFVRELGWSEEELLSRPFVDLVHPDDVASTYREIEKLAGGEPTIRFTNRFLCMDGSYKWLRWNAYPEPETGALYSIARVSTSAGKGAP